MRKRWKRAWDGLTLCGMIIAEARRRWLLVYFLGSSLGTLLAMAPFQLLLWAIGMDSFWLEAFVLFVLWVPIYILGGRLQRHLENKVDQMKASGRFGGLG